MKKGKAVSHIFPFKKKFDIINVPKLRALPHKNQGPNSLSAKALSFLIPPSRLADSKRKHFLLAFVFL
jgi:hypothetical protein